MAHGYARTMFTEAIRRQQERFHSRAAYERLEQSGAAHDTLQFREVEFIRERDSFYMASVTSDGWPYVQHRGGPKGFLKLLDGRTLAFADFAGNKQYITTGNLETNDRVSLFLVDYPAQARLKLIGHARTIELGTEPLLEAKLVVPGYPAKIERFFVIDLVAFDWNCSQHITPRWTEAEIDEAMRGETPG